MDANDVAGGIASPSGEGIAGTCRKHSFLFTTNDIFLSNYVVLPTLSQIYILPCVLATAVLAVASLQASNARLQCTGVRDIDYEKRKNGTPSTYAWANKNCGSSVSSLLYANLYLF